LQMCLTIIDLAEQLPYTWRGVRDCYHSCTKAEANECKSSHVTYKCVAMCTCVELRPCVRSGCIGRSPSSRRRRQVLPRQPWVQSTMRTGGWCSCAYAFDIGLTSARRKGGQRTLAEHWQVMSATDGPDDCNNEHKLHSPQSTIHNSQSKRPLPHILLHILKHAGVDRAIIDKKCDEEKW